MVAVTWKGILVDMARKRPVWTKAMKKKAAEHGRAGGLKGNREGKRLGGLVTWGTRSAPEQEAIRARLRAAGGHQSNKSPKAREAQRARGKAGMLKLSRAKALLLADFGMLKRAPIAPQPAQVPSAAPSRPPLPPGFPERGQYEDDREYMRRVDAWHSAEWRRKQDEAAA